MSLRAGLWRSNLLLNDQISSKSAHRLTGDYHSATLLARVPAHGADNDIIKQETTVIRVIRLFGNNSDYLTDLIDRVMSLRGGCFSRRSNPHFDGKIPKLRAFRRLTGDCFATPSCVRCRKKRLARVPAALCRQ